MTNEELLDILATELEENRGLVSNPILVAGTIRVVLERNKRLASENLKAFAEYQASANLEDKVFTEAQNGACGHTPDRNKE